ncbi:aspartate/glutamate racemase family protein [Bacillus sp. Bva_UNVM-123]|uniref:aspartate/glutamate racemase family protein n=1 Tax=Bacillus sp. Bva_UNVM-123 TaxID=2829798 RepID=UPI00391F0B1C
MKTIGLIGGMSWESSAEYYRIINEEIKSVLGGLHSAKCILSSVDFSEIEHYQSMGNWEMAGQLLTNVAIGLEKAGADFIVICTNTMHKVVPIIEKFISIPILHIADATAAEINKQHIQKVGLLGTKYTMELDFYKNKLIEQEIAVITPSEQERNEVNRIIFEELCLGDLQVQSKEYYKQVITGLIEKGAQGIILGCTEIGLLIKEQDVSIPIFDTAIIHAKKAATIAVTNS